MKQYRFSDTESRILDKITYTKPSELKPLIKYVLSSDNLLGDSSELCILADLKTILGLYDSSKDLKILTTKQKKVIIEHVINDKTQADVAKLLKITQQGVSILLYSALKRIKNYITDGELKWTPWTDDDKARLLNNYGKLPIDILSGQLSRPKSTVVSMYHYLKNKEGTEGGL